MLKVDDDVLSQRLEDALSEEVESGRVEGRKSMGNGRGVWVPGIQNGAMSAVIQQMRQAGYLSTECIEKLGLKDG